MNRLPFAMSFLAVLVCGANAHAQSVSLRSGEAIEGRIVAVHTGIDVTVESADGRVRVIPWADVTTVVPNSTDAIRVGVSIGPVASPPGVVRPGTAPLSPEPGTVPIRFESDGEPVIISRVNTAGTPVDVDPMDASWLRPRYPVTTTEGGYLCTTPCVLWLRPGGNTVHSGGVGRVHSDVFLDVSDPANVRLRSRSAGALVGGLAVGLFGGALVLPGVAIAAFSPLLGFGTSGGSTGDGVVALGAGGGLVAVGAAMLMGGIHLVSTNHAGAERVEPWDGVPTSRPPTGLSIAGIAMAPTPGGAAASVTLTF